MYFFHTDVTKMTGQVTHTETKVGFVYEKSKIGYFQVMRKNSAYSIHKSVQNFDDLVTLNILDALDRKTGVYTASKPGLYVFYFNNLKSGRSSKQHLVLKLNGIINIASLHHPVSDYASGDPTLLLPFVWHWLVSLKTNDQITLHLETEYTSTSSFVDVGGKEKDDVEFNQDVEL